MFSGLQENIIVNYSYSYCCCESGKDTLYSIFTDHLGSWKTVVNETDAQISRQSFDAWGRKRYPQNWNSSAGSAFPFDRGYTGHQHLDEFGLINMNGRMYDVGLCRFLSPDKVVQNPGYTQNYNRYSYCYNNPLKYVDPTGHYTSAYKKYMDAVYGEGNYWYRGNAPGSWGSGGDGGSIQNLAGLPGFFGNGYGMDGVYYDWSSSNYRSTDNNSSVIPWSYVSDLTSNYTGSWDFTFQGKGSLRADRSIVANLNGELNVFRYWQVGGAVAPAMGNSGSSELLIHNSWFNSSIARNMIPDVMTVEVSGVLSFMGGAGIDFGVALVTRGIHAGNLYGYKTQRAKAGFHGGVSINGGGSRYTGPANQIDFEKLFRGYSGSIELDYVVGICVGESNKDIHGHRIISADIGIGPGIGFSGSIGEKTNITHFLSIW